MFLYFLLFLPLIVLLAFPDSRVASASGNLTEDVFDWKIIQLKGDDVFDESQFAVNQNFIELRVNTLKLCVFDTLTIDWRVREEDIERLTDLKSASLIVLSAGETTGLQSSLGRVHSTEVQTEFDIRCVINDLFCKPKTKDIILSTTENFLSIEFDQDTNQPSLPSLMEIEKALSISPALQYEAKAQWKDSRKLEIAVDPLDTQNIIQAYQSGELVEIQVKRHEAIEDFPTFGGKSFRFLEHGKVNLVVMDTEKQSRFSNLVEVEVELCANQSFIPTTKFRLRKVQQQLRTDDNDSGGNRNDGLVKSMFKLAGVLPISGNREITVTNKAVPAIVRKIFRLFVFFIHSSSSS
jgi:hypothetical protein